MGVPIDMLTVDPGLWGHLVRDAARLVRWRIAATRRADMQGIEGGIDREATNHGWKSAPSGFEAGVIRSVVAGAVLTEDRRYRFKLKDRTGSQAASPSCPHCAAGAAGVIEDIQHLWWDCAAWDLVRMNHSSAVSSRDTQWPKCLRYCGILPLGLQIPQVDPPVATAVQRMMAAILLARESRVTGDQPIARLTAGYPWGWAPDGPFEQFGQRLAGAGTPRDWRYSRSFLRAVCSYLEKLKWPMGPPWRTVTYVELALDFEVATGMDLPASKRHRDGTPPPIADRAQAFANILRTLTVLLSPLPVHGGHCIRLSYSLAPLGVPRSAGLSRRPILAGGAETERLLHQLEALSTRKTGRQPVGAPGNQRWNGWGQGFVPQHLPARVASMSDWTGRGGTLGATLGAHKLEPAVPIAGGIAPQEAEKRPILGNRLLPVCPRHRRPICAGCRAKGPHKVPLLRCCAVHHTETESPMVDFCAAHRRTSCGKCAPTGRHSRSADACCALGHHKASDHVGRSSRRAEPPPRPAKRRKEGRESAPMKCTGLENWLSFGGTYVRKRKRALGKGAEATGNEAERPLKKPRRGRENPEAVEE